LALLEDDPAVVKLLETGEVGDSQDRRFLLLAPAGTAVQRGMPVADVVQVTYTAKRYA
jgi:hypothetical protein